MPDVTAARLIIPVKTDAKSATTDLGKLDDSLESLNDSTNENAKATAKAGKSFGSLKKIIAAVGVVALTRQIIKLTDAYTNVNNKLKLVTNGTKDLQKTQKQLFDLAQASRSSFESTAELYARLSRSTRSLGVSNKDLLTVTDAINKSFIVSGASAEEASNAIRQLSQGLAAGALRGDEFNSVAEQAPRLQEAIAASLGVTVGELRALAAEGKITSEVIVKALKGQAAVINKEFDQLTPTFGQVGQTIKNTLLQIGGSIGSQVLPDIAVLGRAFIALSKDGGILVSSLGKLIKGAAFVAKSFALLASIIESISAESKLEDAAARQTVALNNQKNALKTLNATLGTARNEFNLTSKTFAGASKELRNLAENNRNLTRTERDRARQLARTIDRQREIIKAEGKRGDTTKELGRVAEINQVLVDLYKDQEAAVNSNIQSEAALIQTQKRRTASIKDQSEALKILEQAGDPTAFLANQRKAFAEQKKIVAQAGLDVATLEKFQLSQREQQFDNFFKNIANNQQLSFSERQANLQTALSKVLELENISAQERLAAQQAYNQQSALLEQQRFQSLASNVQTGATILGDFNQIAQSLSQVRQNQIAQEIEGLEAAGASEEEIAEKRLQLQRKAAQDQKKFATFAAILDTAAAVTKALASVPPPASYVLAGISAAKGAAQIAAIRSQPIPQAQFGGTFTVPPGNQADSGLLRVNQGEEVNVTPSRQADENGGMKNVTVKIGEQAFDAFLTRKVNDIANSGDFQIRRNSAIKVS